MAVNAAHSQNRPGSSSGQFGGSSGSFEGSSSSGLGKGGGFDDFVAGSDLEENIPGVPGVDYPIYAKVPDTSFLCDGQVEGGYYADPKTDC